jgi:type II secretory pathway component PulF
MEQHDAYLARIAQAVSISAPLQRWLENRNEGGRGVSDPAILKVLEALRTPVPAHRWLQDPTLAAALPLLLRSADMKSVSAETKDVPLGGGLASADARIVEPGFESLEPWCVLIEKSDQTFWASLRRYSYPAILVLLSLLLFLFIAMFIVPVFREMFLDFGLRLPAPTVFLFTASRVVASAPWLAFLVLGILLAITPLLRYFWRGCLDLLEHSSLIRLFRLGSKRSLLAMARWSGTLGELLAIGVPEGQAVLTAGIASDHRFLRVRSEQLAKKLQKEPGDLCSSHWEAASFSSVSIAALDLAHTGATTATLVREIADSYALRWASRGRPTADWIGPFAIVLVGGLVMFILIALLMPLTSMTTSLSS